MEQEQSDKRNASGHENQGSEEAVLGRVRWSPKPQQLQLLEFLFNNGVVNPHKEEATYIRKLLQQYGFVGETSVFYWFQNRRCRTRRRQRLEQQTAARLIAEASPSSMAVTQVEPDSSHAFWIPPLSSHYVLPPPSPPPTPSPAAFGSYASMTDQGNWNLVAPPPPSPPVFSCYEASSDQGNCNLVAPPSPPPPPPPPNFSSREALADQDNSNLVTRPPSYRKTTWSADKRMGVTKTPSPSSPPPTLGN